MVVSNFTETFFGLPIADYNWDDKPRPGVVHRLMQEYESDQTQRQLLDQYLGKVDKSQLRALVLGSWGDAATGTPPQEFIDGLVEYRLPQFKALYSGDMTYECAEISWIVQANYSKFLEAYPGLEALRIRGSQIGLPTLDLPELREFAIETGGLPKAIPRMLAESRLPSLKHLELWLGADEYGCSGDLDDFIYMLERIQPERLEYLGLRNSEFSDEIAQYLAEQPWLGKLKVLDLSMGTLGDDGAEALVESPHLEGLGTLNVSHHYIGESFVKQLKALPLKLIIDDAQDEDEDRYVEVGE
jgi:hypothetical protein